jgi:hypothetical protein
MAISLILLFGRQHVYSIANLSIRNPRHVQISNSVYSHFVLEILMNDLVHDSVELDYTIS